MFMIDTGERHPEITATTFGMDEETQRIRITSFSRCRAIYRKIMSNIGQHECPDALDEYWSREDLMIDAIHLFDPAVSAELVDAYRTHRSALIHGGAYRSASAVPSPAAPGNPSALTGNTEKDDNDDLRF